MRVAPTESTALPPAARDVVAEGRDLRVGDHDADLRPGLDHDTAGLGDGALDEAGLAGVGGAWR